MATTLVQRLFKIRDCKYQRTYEENGATIIGVKHKPARLICPECNSEDVIRKGTKNRRVKTLPVGAKAVYLDIEQQRIECKHCGALRWLIPSSIRDGVRHTKAFERYALELLKHMTIKDVAEHLLVSWTYVKDLQKEHLSKHFGRPRLKDVKFIGMDEVSIGRGHKYFTIVLDLESGEVLYVGDGKGGDALKDFWVRLRGSGAKIQAVSSDLSPAYLSAISHNLPKAVHVYDHFHVVKLFNDKLTELRRELYDEITDRMHKKVLKGTRWLLLKRPEHLKEDEVSHLEEALRLNKPLATAYYMKEYIRLLWSQPNKREAEKLLKYWVEAAQKSGVKILQEMAKQVLKYRSGILAWYDFPLSNGALEGTNNKIGLIQRASYGLRDKEFFKLKIYACKNVRNAIVG